MPPTLIDLESRGILIRAAPQFKRRKTTGSETLPAVTAISYNKTR